MTGLMQLNCIGFPSGDDQHLHVPTVPLTYVLFYNKLEFILKSSP